MRRPAALAVAAFALATSLPAGAAGRPTLAAYRARVNALCRANTPRFQRAEADLAQAKLSGDAHRAAYDFGVVLGLSLREGLGVERAPLPVVPGARLTVALGTLHAVDAELREVLAAALAGDSARLRPGLARLTTLAKPLNRQFDAAGLRDCGSNQQ